MLNLNRAFQGKMDIINDLVLYVDESGDEGFKFSSNCSEWFVVGGIALTSQQSNEMIKTLKEYRDKYAPQKKISKLSFKEMTHLNRKNALSMLSIHKYIGLSSVFYKPKIDPADRMCTYPSMYFVGVKNIIERATWLTSQYKKNKVHILISTRNHIVTTDLQKYLFDTSINAHANLSYMNKLGVVALSTPENNEKLLLADYAAASIFQYLEKTGEARLTEQVYFDLYLKKKLYSSTHPKYGGVWGNGIKCTPTDQVLIENSGILEEGSHSI